MSEEPKKKRIGKNSLIQTFPKEEFLEFKTCLIKQLKMVTRICDAYKVRYHIDCGTLLGLYRGGDFIYPDFDNDIGVCMEDITPEFITALRNAGLFRNLEIGMYWGYDELLNALSTDKFYKPKVLKIKDQTKGKKFFGNKISITTDLFFWIENGENRYSNLYSDWELVQKVKNIGEYSVLKTQYGDFKAPVNIEEYLADMYGDDWRVPNPGHKDKPNKVRGLKYRWDTGEVSYNFVRKESKIFEFSNTKERRKERKEELDKYRNVIQPKI